MHQNRSHHHHGTAEGSFTAKKWFGHRAGRSPCAHSIGKFFLCYIVFFSSETSAPGSPGNYLYIYNITIYRSIVDILEYELSPFFVQFLQLLTKSLPSLRLTFLAPAKSMIGSDDSFPFEVKQLIFSGARVFVSGTLC